MKALFAMAAALVVSLPALAEEDVFAGLKRGERIHITTKDGNHFKGVVKSIVGDNLKVEVTYDSSGTVGSVGFERENILRIVSLGAVSEEEMARIEREKAEDAERRAAEETKKPPVDVNPEDGETKKEPTEEEKATALLAKYPTSEWSAVRRAEILEKSEFERTEEEKAFLVDFADWEAATKSKGRELRRALLKKFPPADGWGPEKYEVLKNTTAVIGRELTADEKEFVDRFEEWKMGLAEFKEMSEGTEKPKEEPEGEKKENW